jgi:hypothetical protein
MPHFSLELASHNGRIDRDLGDVRSDKLAGGTRRLSRIYRKRGDRKGNC